MKLSLLRFAISPALLILAASAGHSATLVIESNSSDNHITNSTAVPGGGIQDGGGTPGTQGDAIRIGGGGTSPGAENLVGSFAFQLPTLLAGEIFTDATFTFRLTTKDGTVTGFNGDVYAIATPRATAALNGADFFIGAFGADPTDAVALQDNFLNSAIANDTLLTSSATGSTNFTNFLNALYGGNTDPVGGPGQFLFLRINPDADPLNGNNRYRVAQQANVDANDPRITLTTAVPEPSTAAMLLAGMVFIGGGRRRRRQR